MHLSFSVGQFLLSEEHFSCAVGTRRKYFCIYSDCASSFTRTVSVGTSSYDRWPFENMRRSIALPFRTKVLRTFANKASFVRRVVHHRTLRNQKVQEKVVRRCRAHDELRGYCRNRGIDQNIRYTDMIVGVFRIREAMKSIAWGTTDVIIETNYYFTTVCIR